MAARGAGVPPRRQGDPIRNNDDRGAAKVFTGTVGTVTALSVVERQLTCLPTG